MILSKIKDGCAVGFYGLGRSNLALISCLPLEKGRITLRSDRKIDQNDIPRGVNIERILLGEDAVRDISEEVLFFSPSVRRDRAEFAEAKERGVFFSSDAELFFEEVNTPVYAITGSDGKSTTAALTQLLLKASGKHARLIGNIGEPMVKNLTSDVECYVVELSSFMLEYMAPRSKSACITNLTPNHLDWHESFEKYRKSKLNVTKTAERIVIFDDLSDIVKAQRIVSTSRDYRTLKQNFAAESFFTVESGYICRNGEKLLRLDEIKRREEHDIKNLMMAIAMTDGDVRRDAIGRVAGEFSGLPHRCEVVLSKGGVDFIDSSIDSTPARTAQTLRSLDRSVVIILGGRGKGLDYRSLLPEIKKYVRRAIIVGENAREIYGIVENCVRAEIVGSFDEAVIRGAELARSVGTLLLSPASTSFDLFKNYEERGDKFREILSKIY